jgi:hypothetical protein
MQVGPSPFEREGPGRGLDGSVGDRGAENAPGFIGRLFVAQTAAQGFWRQGDGGTKQ